MPLDTGIAQRAEDLNSLYDVLPAELLIRLSLKKRVFGRVAIVSSFGADSVVLLHMVAQIDPDAPILFLDTGKHFPETLAYLDTVVAHLGLTNVQRIIPSGEALAIDDPAGDLYSSNPKACCDIRKTRPLDAALQTYDAWISGRKRAQAATRLDLMAVEAEAPSRLKLNPLRDWTAEDIKDYIARHDLPAHPLVEQGYPSIGCATCTTPVHEGEDARAGRWRGADVVECGIHFIGGRIVRDKDLRVIVTDTGAVNESADTPEALLLAPEALPDPAEVVASAPAVIEVTFPAFNDGRGFTLGHRLRRAGFTGRLRAAGPLLPDQYAMARRSGFDEVVVPGPLFRRQGGAEVWASRADWQDHDHRGRLAG